MERDLAAALMREFLALSRSLNGATSLAMQLTDEEEKQAMLRSLGSVMDIVYAELMRPIIERYPELDPDRDSAGSG